MDGSSHQWLTRIAPCPSIAPAGFPAKSLCGCSTTASGWVEPKRIIYDHELVLIQQGGYRIEVDDATYLCSDNTYLIVPPNRWHISTCLNKGRRHYAHFDWQYQPVAPDCPVMTFHPALPRRNRFRPAPSFVPPVVMHGVIPSPVVAFDLIQRLQLMLRSDNPHEWLASRGVLLELLIRLIDPRPRQTTPQHRAEELAHRIRETIDQFMFRPDSKIAIRPLLSGMGHSYEHLARVFRRQYGLTPLDYVQSIRIERAKHLLRQTDMKLPFIAGAVGYEDAVYFSRLFKRHTGMSPGRFRRD